MASVCVTALLRGVMVEKGDADAALEVAEMVGNARRAIGLVALVTTLARDRMVREAVLHRLRLKADMTD